jgi:hypothetical protein
MAIQYYVPHERSADFLREISDWIIIAGGFAAFLGVFNLIHVHSLRIRRAVPGWGYSLVLFAGIALMLILGITSKGEMVLPGGIRTSFGWGYEYMLRPLQATMFSILAFFIASAAFRAFRLRTFNSFLLFLAAVTVMFGIVTLGEFTWSAIRGALGLPYIGEIADWILGGPNMAGRRGVMLGVTLGGVAMALKVILGIEKIYLGGRE